METDELHTPGAPRPLRRIGGQLALDFVDTIDVPAGERFDHLQSYATVVSWSAWAGAIDSDTAERLARTAEAHPRQAAAMFGKAHRLRAVLTETFGGLVDGGSASEHVWTGLRPYVAAGYGAATLAGAPGEMHWSWRDADDLATALHPVAVAAAELLVSDELPMVKRCANCPWLFVDRSRNHGRRWCDMNDCGRVRKIELYVARRRARSRQEGVSDPGGEPS